MLNEMLWGFGDIMTTSPAHFSHAKFLCHSCFALLTGTKAAWHATEYRQPWGPPDGNKATGAPLSSLIRGRTCVGRAETFSRSRRLWIAAALFDYEFVGPAGVGTCWGLRVGCRPFCKSEKVPSTVDSRPRLTAPSCGDFFFTFPISALNPEKTPHCHAHQIIQARNLAAVHDALQAPMGSLGFGWNPPTEPAERLAFCEIPCSQC
ncbi:uncharacterized protein EV422DRAFT_56795 [Fimicolochytrium jonesii]|uniref:uncharacterized protein n=1 Tax=Fimicolochytrium jonesii TaxID=1396493 RepID=UPI0022FE521F|nr:uncharacterized protein EV422DRAFT_56795 [Fimicolochytrium jonesii]KAI8821175.1 hypothetical protein EV422DRAFT_56795 [Fimicolochytrium jonesii]